MRIYHGKPPDSEGAALGSSLKVEQENTLEAIVSCKDLTSLCVMYY